MCLWLKQSTAVVVSFGPFVSQSDAVTLKTGLAAALDHGTTGIFLSKNGGTAAIRHATVTTSVSDAYGMYKVTLDTTDTATLGSLRVSFADATTNLVVWQDFHVVAANIYDSFIGGGDILDVSATQWLGGTIPAVNVTGVPLVDAKYHLGTIYATPATAGIPDVNVKNIDNDAASASGTVTFPNAILASTTNITAGTITTATNVTTVNGLAANVITAASAASDFGTEIAAAVKSAEALETGATASSVTATGLTLAGTYETNALIGSFIDIRSATTGAHQGRTITANTASAITVATWAPALTGTVTYDLWTAPPAISAATVATAVRTELTTELGRIDVATSTRSTVTTAQVNTECDTALSDIGLTSGVVTKMSALPSATAGTNGGVFIAGTNAATTITTGLTAAIVGNITGNLSGSVGSVTGAVGSVTGAVGSVTGAVGSVTGAVGSVTGNVGGNVTGSIGSLASQAKADVNAEADTAILDAALVSKLDTIDDFIDTEVAAIKTKTDFLPSVTAGAAGGVFIAGSNAATTVNLTGNITGNLSGSVGSVTGAVGSVTAGLVLTTAGNEAVADAFLGRNINGSINTGRTVKQAFAALRNKVVVDRVGLTFSVKDTDDTTELWAGVITTASGNPISSIDPA